MKRISLKTMVWWMCMTTTIILTGCEPSSVDPCEEQTNNRIARFREYCYDANGNVKLSHLEGYEETEWGIHVHANEEVYTIFKQLTDLSIEPSENLEYSYHSEDYRYVCRLIGNQKARNDWYATLYLWIEGCPEIETIHFIRKR